MQCYNCRSQVPEGVTFCQQCGAPVSSPPPPSIPPTVMASQSSPGGSGANYDPLAPTIAASQPSYGNPTPYTNYNPSVPGSGQAYESAQNPYANVPYGQSQPGNIPPYTPPPPNNIPPYTPPSQGQHASYGVGGAPFASSPPVKRKSNVGIIVGVVIAVLVIACVGSAFAVFNLARTVSPANTVDATTPPILSGNTVDPTAASILTNIQMASAIDRDTAEPKTLATRFRTGDTVYVTYDFDFRNTDVTLQHPGYTQAKYYVQNRLYHTTKSLKIDDTVATSGQGYAYFGYPYDDPTTAGAVEVYWCRLPSCSDGKLAGTETFTVS